MSKVRRVIHLASPAALFAILLIMWEVGIFNKAFDIPYSVLPRLSSILAYMAQKSSVFLEHTSITLYEGLAAFVMGSCLGMTFGILIFQSKFLRETIYPLLIMFNSAPKSAMVPLFIIWFGVGTVPAILLGALISFFPVMINTLLGFGATPSVLLDLAHSLKAGGWKTFSKIRFPNTLPHIFTALRIAAPLSLVGVSISEIVASDAGLGYLIAVSQHGMIMPLMYGAIILMVILGISFFLMAVLLEKLLIPWYKRYRM